jgi:hypothetical protein
VDRAKKQGTRTKIATERNREGVNLIREENKGLLSKEKMIKY